MKVSLPLSVLSNGLADALFQSSYYLQSVLEFEGLMKAMRHGNIQDIRNPNETDDKFTIEVKCGDRWHKLTFVPVETTIGEDWGG